MANSLYKIFENNKYDLEDAKKQSKAWFAQQALLLRRKRYTPIQVFKDNPDKLSKKMLLGRMYMFFYDPKTKEELPYYDRFPLIFPFRIESGGFYGINFHYLPYFMRVKILDRLMTFSTNNSMDENTRLKLSWGLLSGSTKFAAVKPCVKHYLTSHVKSLYRNIPSEDWVTAMLLPVEQFSGASAPIVWSESKKLGRF